MTSNLEQLLDELVRPALRAHNGDVELVSYQDGILRLRMLGQCAAGPAATMTNETLIEGQLKPLLPQLKEVILVHTVNDSLLAEARALMTRAPGRGPASLRQKEVSPWTGEPGIKNISAPPGGCPPDPLR